MIQIDMMSIDIMKTDMIENDTMKTDLIRKKSIKLLKHIMIQIDLTRSD